VIVVGRRAAILAAPSPGSVDAARFFDVQTISRADASSFSDGEAKGFAVAIRISVDAPILSVLASIFLVPKCCRRHEELSAETGVQRL
jgi:hypothetical protein